MCIVRKIKANLGETALVMVAATLLVFPLMAAAAPAEAGGTKSAFSDACSNVDLTQAPDKPVVIRYGQTGGGEEPLALLWSVPREFDGYGTFYTIKHSKFTPSQRLTAYMAGQIDAGSISFPALLTAVNKGLSLRAVASLVEVTPTDNEGAFAVLDGTPTAFDLLEGAKVGYYGPNTSSEYWIESAFYHAGVDSSSLSFVALPPPAQEAALRNGTIKVAWLARQFLAHAKKKGGIEVLGSPYDMVGMQQPSLSIFFSPAFIRKHTKAYCSWRADYQKSMQIWLDHMDQSIDILVKSGYLTKAAAHAGPDAGRDRKGEISLSQYADTIEDMVTTGFLKKMPVDDVSDLVMNKYALIQE